jgi:WD40 repeat-containing protein SMU1
MTDIYMGRWDLVLSQISSLQLPKEKLMAIYEQIVLELLEARENDLAKEVFVLSFLLFSPFPQLLRTTEPLQLLKLEYPDRYAKLESLCLRPAFSSSEAYEMNSSKDKKRREIAESLSSEITTAAPSRLMTLIGQALRFQQTQGLLPRDGSFDLFRGVKRSVRKDNEELLPRREVGHIKFNPDSHPETVLFSPDNLSLATGSVDGFIEIWDYDTCRLRKDLDYQAKEELMMHEDEPIICSTFNREGELLATGGRDGKVKVWKVSTGVCLRKFTKAHSQGVTCLSFSRDSSHLLTGSFDTLARVHGLKSGKILKEFRGHTSIVNAALYTKDNSNIVTGSSDGTVRLWDARTTECLFNFRSDSLTSSPCFFLSSLHIVVRPSLSAGSLSTTLGREFSIHTIQLIPNNPDLLFIGVKAPQAFITTTNGQVCGRFFLSLLPHFCPLSVRRL